MNNMAYKTDDLAYKTGDLVEIKRVEHISDNILGRYTRTSMIPAIIIRGSVLSTYVMDRPYRIEDRARYTILVAGKACSVDEDIICKKLSREAK